ncbi:MAG: hypothetical protein N2322_06165 [Terrimicrobiaceae bacterium]|nr:hypothetical protein [Terrimicrobiaceae bacterium]
MRVRSPEALWACSRRLYRGGWPRLARMVKTLNWALHKCLLPAEAEVGEGVELEHYALGIVMHPQVTIGSHCRIYHHVTLASQSPIGSPFRIILEEGVEIGAHSIIVARPGRSLVVGAGSVLGAGAVLTRDIPPGEVWAGNPARLLHPKQVANSGGSH